MTRHPLKSPLSILGAAALALSAGCAASTSDAHATPNERTADAYKLSLRAQEAQKAGRIDDAISLYHRALELQPNMPGTWNNYGVLLMEKQAYMDAAEALKREADISPDDPRPYSNLGLVYQRAGWLDESYRYYNLALDRDPNWLEALRGLARTSQRLNKADDRLLDHMKRALLLEHDAQWRSTFEAQRLRVEGLIREQKDTGRIKTAGTAAP